MRRASTRDPRYQEMLVRLRKAREESGLTQVQASFKLGKYHSFVTKVETGERRIDPIELTDFAKLYKKSSTAFLR